MLGDLGHVEPAESLKQAREKIEAGDFGLILVDDHLPDGEGIDWVRALRRDTKHAALPVVLYCASLNNTLAYEAVHAGFNLCLAKPMDPAVLGPQLVSLAASPSCQVVRPEFVTLTTTRWSHQGRHFAYSPDLNQRLAGPDAASVDRAMQSLLEAAVRHGPTSPMPAGRPVLRQAVHVTTHRHVVVLDAAA